MSAVDVQPPAVHRAREFVQWVGAGRPLTQTGRLRLAAAIELAEVLDTDDHVQVALRSSGDLYHLSLLMAWFKAAGLVRPVRGRLVVVRRNAALVERPAQLVTRLLDALPNLGGEFGDSVVCADAEHTVAAVLEALVAARGALALEDASEVAWNVAIARYWFPDATALQLETQRRLAHYDARRMLALVADLGLLTVSEHTAALTDSGEQTIRSWLGMGSEELGALRVRVTLEDSDPLVWRQLVVPANIRLDRFHQVLADAMGWQDYHLHCFERDDERWGPALEDLDSRDERGVTLGALLRAEGDRLLYDYDFGDGWRHDVVLEATAPSDGRSRCLDGGGRCPPEDVGGIPGYEHLRAVLANPRDPEHEDMVTWLGIADARSFDPAAFNAADAALRY